MQQSRPDPIRVAIADDHEMIRAGVRTLLMTVPDMTVVAEAGTAREAVDVAELVRPDVMLVDLDMPGGGLSVMERLRMQEGGPRILAFTMHDDATHLQAVLGAGGHGYLVKTAGTDAIQHAIRAVHAGRLYADVAFGQASGQDGRVPEDDDVEQPCLSGREREVLGLLAQGHTHRAVADHLGISSRTVETYRNRIAEKLGLKSRVDLVEYAVRRGLLSNSPARTSDR